jgi:hypothetical protein
MRLHWAVTGVRIDGFRRLCQGRWYGKAELPWPARSVVRSPRSDGVPLATRDVNHLLSVRPQPESDRPGAVVSTWTLRGARAACVMTGTSLRIQRAAARMEGPWERGGNSLDSESRT